MAAATAPLIHFDHVGLRYPGGPEVLRDLTFSIPAGAFVFVTGPSGAGKTSLIRLLYLGHRPSRGLIRLFGQDIATLPREELPAIRRRIGVVFQDFRLLDHLSVVDNVALPLRLAGADFAEVDEPVRDLLRWVGLGERLDASPATLSGGEQQRVAIARAVINQPAILLADEPTGNVDDRIAARLMHLFGQLHKMGTTVVVATHNKTLIEEAGHSVMTLKDGCLYPGLLEDELVP
ncbi:MAG: cell division ATP-binding protein FtsE [Azospirillaceae bacterium]